LIPQHLANLILVIPRAYAAFDASSKTIVSGGLDRQVFLWDTQQKDRQPIGSLRVDTKVGALTTAKTGAIYLSDETPDISIIRIPQ